MNLETATLRRVTGRLVPFLILLYVVAFIDRSAVGFAKLQMGTDVGIGDAAYGLGAGLFFIGYFLFEVPSNLALDRFGARRWFARILITWGVITVAMAFTNGPEMFYTLRFLLGAAEAGLFPGIIYYITTWYPVRHRSKILGYFILAQPVALMITSPLSGWAMSAAPFGLRGWQWLFIVVGVPAIFMAWPTLKVLPEGPKEARWLNEDQKNWIAQQLENDRIKYGQSTHGNPLRALGDRRVLMLCLQYLPACLAVYGLSLWMPTIVNAFGGSTLQTGFVSAVPYLFGIAGLLFIPRYAGKLRENYAVMSVLYALGGMGLYVTATVPDPVLQVAALSLTALCLFSVIAVFWTIPGTFLLGTSAAAGIALINSVGNLGGYIGPFAIGAIKEATGSLAGGMYLLAGAMVFGAAITWATRVIIRRSNPTTGAASIPTETLKV
ncbi:MFS transporter [Pseudarthrobacter sp. NPDC080039]|uniref:MFS transporter n=1 Tax=unclassified Pseudarthrobacter TaxID=2647000 RepID=UPI00344F18BD